MIDVVVTFDLLPDIDQQAYGEISKKAVGTMLQAPGFVELRSNRNMLGSPQMRVTEVWQSLADWARYHESTEVQAHEAELKAFTTNDKVEIWGPSPVMPEPIRPGE